jgi:hypothetical protein
LKAGFFWKLKKIHIFCKAVRILTSLNRYLLALRCSEKRASRGSLADLIQKCHGYLFHSCCRVCQAVFVFISDETQLQCFIMDIRLHKYNTAVWVHSIGMTLAMEN